MTHPGLHHTRVPRRWRRRQRGEWMTARVTAARTENTATSTEVLPLIFVLFPFFVLLWIFILTYLVIIIVQNICHWGSWWKYKFSWTWIYLTRLRIVRVPSQKVWIIALALDLKVFEILFIKMTRSIWFLATLANIVWLLLLFIWTLLIFR